MAALLDANFLLALATDGHQHSPAAANWIRSEEAGPLVVCRVAQLALMRLLNNPSVMGDSVLTVDGCWDIWNKLRHDLRIRVERREPAGLDEEFQRYTRGRAFSPKLWNDAYLAAYARAAGLRLVTFDKGFRSFSGLELEILT